MKYLILTGILLLGASAGRAQPVAPAQPGKMSVAVLELEPNGVSRTVTRALTDRLRVELFRIGRFDLMERDKVQDILKEQKFMQSGCTSAACLIEIGRLISVNGMISGSLGKLGRKYIFNLQLVDVETGMILATATEECACALEDLTSLMVRVAQKVAGVEARDEFTIQYFDKDLRTKGNFYIKSSPSGAVVYLNGKMIRNVVTPLTIEDLPAGQYTIRAEKGDYARTVSVVLKSNEFRKIDLPLEIKQGKLMVSTNIPQADVYLDHQAQGKTPLVLPFVKVGTYQLKIKKGGYLDYEKEITISDHRETVLSVEMAKPGPLKILSVPMEAEIYLDNERKGRTPIVLSRLRPGPHRLLLKKKGFKDHRETVVIDTDLEKKIEPTLVPLNARAEKELKKLGPGKNNRIDKTMKWLTILGAGGFITILVLLSAG